MWARPGLYPPVARLFHRQLRSGFTQDPNSTEAQNRPFLCSFLVTAGLQDKRAPFEPRGGPEMGKDKNQAGQMGPNPHPLWYRAPQVFCVPACHVDFDSRTGIPAPKHLGGSVPKGVWVGAHLTCLVFVFAHFGAAPGFKCRPFVLYPGSYKKRTQKRAVLCLCRIGVLWKRRSELPVEKASNRRTQPGAGPHPN